MIVFVALASVGWGGTASAAACTSTSFASYAALGSGGCTIGNLSFGNFQLRTPQTGAIASAAITVTPMISGASVVGLRFGVAPTASGGLFYDDLITYRVTGVAANVIGATVDFTGSSASGDAAVSVAEQLCLGGTFGGADGVSGCTTSNTLNLAVIDIGFGADPAYTLAFNGVGSLGVVSDLAFDSGSGFVAGSASTLTSGINLFRSVGVAAVPEPTDALLLVAGVVAMAVARRRTVAARR